MNISESKIFIENGNTWVSYRSFIEALGYKVFWDKDDYAIYSCNISSLENICLIIDVNKKVLISENNKTDIQNDFKIIDSQAYIKISILSEILNYWVQWDSRNTAVNINQYEW